MSLSKTVLSQNIKYLRKLKGISQEELAKELNIKRSNIAAYESKNVEPRLRIILELSRFFDISVGELIEKLIDDDTSFNSFNRSSSNTNLANFTIAENHHERLSEFTEKSAKISKVLEGFKSYYAFRKLGIETDSPDKRIILNDIDNFIQLMDHLLQYNKSVVKALLEKTTSKSA